MELPAIGWDPASRTGRGYVQGRIRAENLVYFEAEYRVNLSRDGLWGAAGFLNFTSASDPITRGLASAQRGRRDRAASQAQQAVTHQHHSGLGLGAGGSHGLFLGTGEAF